MRYGHLVRSIAAVSALFHTAFTHGSEPAEPKFLILPAQIALDLGEARDVPLPWAGTQPPGGLKVSAKLIPPLNGVSVKIIPDLATTDPHGTPAHFVLTAQAEASAVSTHQARIEVRMETALLTIVRQISFSVAPIYRVSIVGSDPDRWSGGGTIAFRPHQDGLRLQFKNEDNQPHWIHGEGAIPHASEAIPPGGTYEVVIPASEHSVTGSYRCHLHENESNLKIFQFNALSDSGIEGNSL